jgi:hypothetical protein
MREWWMWEDDSETPAEKQALLLFTFWIWSGFVAFVVTKNPQTRLTILGLMFAPVVYHSGPLMRAESIEEFAESLLN